MVIEQYSSFQIGKMLQVSRQAVNQWIDKGYIPSYRTPGGHRRVRRNDLVDFLKHRQIPLPQLLLQNDHPEGPSSPTIMLVDDEEDYLLILEQAIRQAMPHARLLALRNGLDALVAIGAKRPDLLILDLHMPMIDGLEVCRRLKRNEHTLGLPIMIVTAYSAEDLDGGLQGLSVDCFCSKSQPLDEITRRVCDFFPIRPGVLPAGV